MVKNLLLSAFVLLFGYYAVYAQGKCNDLFISEYMDGPNKNKVLEVYNPSDVAVDLTNYSIKIFNNGAPTPLEIDLVGILPPKETYVVSHPQADATILAKSDLTDNKMNYDGNDAIVLNKGQSTYIDKIGEIGVNPGQAGWNVLPSGSTKGQDLRRKYVVEQGEIDWNQGKSQWEIHPSNAIQNIKDHDNTCKSATAAEINFLNTDGGSFVESYTDDNFPDNIRVALTITGTHTEAVYGIITVNGFNCNHGGTAADGNGVDYNINTTSVEFPANDNSDQFVEITLIDDNMMEGNEFICLDLTVSGTDVYFGNNNYHQIEIIDNEMGGIEDYQLEGINIFPSHPADDLTVENKGNNSKELNMEVINSLGQVLKKSAWDGARQMNVNIADLASGTYMVRVTDTKTGKMFTSKFLK